MAAIHAHRRAISSPPGYDPDAVAYLNAAGISTAVTYYPGTAYQIAGTDLWTAVNTFFVGIKNAGVWVQTTSIYLYIGGTATSHSVNARAPGSYNLGFSSSPAPTHSATGQVSTGGGYALTGYVFPAGAAGAKHLAVYSRTNNTIGGGDIGGASSLSDGLFTYYQGFAYCFLSETLNDKVANTDTRGLFLGTRTGSSKSLYRNGGLLAAFTNTPTTASAGGICIGNANNQPSTREFCFASFGADLTNAQQAAYYNLIQALQTTLLRQV